MIKPEVLAQCRAFDPDVFSDLYKDLTGCRPRMDLSTYSAAELDELYQSTVKDLQDEIEQGPDRWVW